MGISMKFHKMHGIGNDYIYFNCMEEDIEDKVTLTKMVSDRHTGVGSDGAIFICKSDVADAEMVMYNFDGSYSEMCGNGMRCVAKYIYDFGIVDKTEFVVESGGALKYISITPEIEAPNPVTGKKYGKRKDGLIAKSIKVDMGTPIFEPEKVPVSIPGFSGEMVIDYPINVDSGDYRMTCISVGNPHTVVFVDDVKGFDIDGIGSKFEKHEWFPKKINAEFARVINRNEVEMRVYERGAGETRACGTGATATAIAAILNGHTENEVTIHLLGGDLVISWDRELNRVFMSGPAEFVCEGDI